MPLPDHHRGSADPDRVRRSRLDDHVALPSGEEPADPNGEAADGDDPADMRFDPIDERTGMSVALGTPSRLTDSRASARSCRR